jgi:hypothetical protein
VLFARNVDPREGDLAPASREEITQAFDGADIVYVDQSEATAADVSQASSRREYWKYLILGVLGLLALETYLAQRFGHWK